MILHPSVSWINCIYRRFLFVLSVQENREAALGGKVTNSIPVNTRQRPEYFFFVLMAEGDSLMTACSFFFFFFSVNSVIGLTLGPGTESRVLDCVILIRWK